MSTPLRIAIDLRRVADGDRGGIARFAVGVTEALASREWLTVLPFAHGDLPVSLPVEVHHLRGGRELVREQMALPPLLRRLGADVLLSPANRGLPLVSPCPMVLVLYDVAEWDRALIPAPEGSAATRFAYANAVSLSRAARIVTTSEHSAGAIRRRLGIAEERIRVVPGGIEERFLEDPGVDAVARARERYGVIPGSILHVGSLHVRKDLPTLIRAVSHLPASVAPRLVLAGAGPEEEGLRAMARMIGMADRLHLAGFVEDADLPAVYRAASCVVLAGTGEGFGLPVLEAMAAGTPVIAARAGALPEVVGRAGLLFGAGDAGALAAHLRDVLGSRDEASRLGAAGRDHAALFSWDRAARGIEAVLHEAVALGRGERFRSEAGSLRSLTRWIR
jgi:glycosyltransferase involved in cell wall biosynthesis